MIECVVRRPGRIGYAEALDLQRALVRARRAGTIPDTLLLLEHPAVITIGKVGRDSNVLADGEALTQRGIEVVRTDRGGDITYHGPGQIVGYPIVDLHDLKQDVKWYLTQLEEVMIATAARFGVIATRQPGLTGIWVGDRKLGAIGVRVEGWVTSHGFALNVSTDLDGFGLIVPCGIFGKGVTSLSVELQRDVSPGDVFPVIIECFGGVFGRRMRDEESFVETSDPTGARRT